MPGRDEARWIEMYAMLEKPLYNVVYRVIWDAAESQDLVQEAFLRCWKRRAAIRDDGLKAVLFRTALNLAINRRRRMRLWRMVGLGTAGGEPELTSRCEETLQHPVRRALDALPDGLRQVLLLTELAGMSYTEVATTLGIREGTVGSRRTRALEHLRRQLKIDQEAS